MTALLPTGVKVHLALGYTDLRKGMDGLALLVQEILRQDPFTGHLFVCGCGPNDPGMCRPMTSSWTGPTTIEPSGCSP